MTSSTTHSSPDSRPDSSPATDSHRDTYRNSPRDTQRDIPRDGDLEAPRDASATEAVPAPPPEPRSILGLTVAQVAGSSLAAVSSALAASFLGVAGTIAGALVGSLVGTVGTAVYSHSLHTAGTRLRTLAPRQKLAPVETSGRARTEAREVHGPLRADRPARRRPLLMLGAGVAMVFVIALGAITLAEMVLGHPVSSSSGGGTTIGRAVTPQGSGPGSGGTTPNPAATTSATTPTASTTPLTASVPSTAATGSATGSATSPGASTSASTTTATSTPTGSATTLP
jgi:hypothetical protein